MSTPNLGPATAQASDAPTSLPHQEVATWKSIQISMKHATCREEISTPSFPNQGGP